MPEVATNLSESEKPEVYSTTGPLTLGPSLAVTQKGTLEAVGGGVVPGATVNCGSFS